MARILAFALGGLFCHQLVQLPDPLYVGLLPLLLPVLLGGNRGLSVSAGFLAGVAWTALAAHQGLASRLPDRLQGRDLTVAGEVTGVPSRKAGRIRFVLDLTEVDGGVEGWRWRGCRLHLTWYRAADAIEVRSGEQWRATVRLKVPRGARNHAGFDREHRALRDGICATGYLRPWPAPVRVGSSRPGLHRFRETLARRLETRLGGVPAAGLVRALAVGLRDRVSAEQRWTMQATGTAHLMAISGLHVGLAAAAGLLLTGLITRAMPWVLMLLPRQHWGALGALAAAGCYAGLAGFSIPTQRALFMLVAYLAASLARRRCARVRPLAIALGALLLVDPLAVHDPATWLSFTAVAGLMWALAPRPPSPGPRASRWIAEITRLQLAACAVIAPVTLLFFSYQSLVSPLANLLAVPLTALVAVPAILVGLVLDVAGLDLGGALLRFAAHTLGVLLEILHGLPARAHLLVPAAAPSTLAVASGLVGVGLLVSMATPWLRLLGLAWLAPLALPPGAAPDEGQLEVRVLDVGQGLASIVRTRNHVLVFDAGPSWGGGGDAGAGIVAPALRRAGVARVDTLIISHHHDDHAGGAAGLARTTPLDRVLGAAHREGHRRPCVAGIHWHWDGFDFHILHPEAPARAGNDASCVLRVSGPAGSALFPADVERRGERDLLERHAGRLASTLLVVPHHGSRTSSTAAFIDAVSPQVAINSSGHRNRFRLPAPEVTARYRSRGVRLLDTACDGEVTVTLSPGGPPRIRTWRQREIRFWHAREQGAHCESAGASRLLAFMHDAG